jgi:hypothetical protein
MGLEPGLEQNWASHPEEWQPLVERWARERAAVCSVAEFVQLGEHRVLALSLGASPPEHCAARLFVAVPHAHEPAGTAACVDVACELLTGAHLNGEPSDLPRGKVLECLHVTLVPDANPQGRARSPERVWDGTHDNDHSLAVAFGVAADGARFGRYPRWRFSEHRPRQTGIIYERIADDVWVEPNTDTASAHCRLMDRLHDRYAFTHYLSLHQHEHTEAGILPSGFAGLPAARQEELGRWSDAVLAGWRRVGAVPRPEPQLPYPGQLREKQFEEFWAGRCPGMLRLTAEVQNNRHMDTGAALAAVEQQRRSRAALVATLLLLLERTPGGG